jgi:hypothetical protein
MQLRLAFCECLLPSGVACLFVYRLWLVLYMGLQPKPPM